MSVLPWSPSDQAQVVASTGPVTALTEWTPRPSRRRGRGLIVTQERTTLTALGSVLDRPTGLPRGGNRHSLPGASLHGRSRETADAGERRAPRAHGPPQEPASQVLLRHHGVEAFRGHHGAARVLPDPHRARAPRRDRPRSHARGRPAGSH